MKIVKIIVIIFLSAVFGYAVGVLVMNPVNNGLSEVAAVEQGVPSPDSGSEGAAADSIIRPDIPIVIFEKILAVNGNEISVEQSDNKARYIALVSQDTSIVALEPSIIRNGERVRADESFFSELGQSITAGDEAAAREFETLVYEERPMLLNELVVGLNITFEPMVQAEDGGRYEASKIMVQFPTGGEGG